MCFTALLSFLFVVVGTLTSFVTALILGPAAARGAARFVRRASILFWVASVLLALLDRLVHRDWVHLFWTTQIPITTLFLCSGVLLATTWRDDAAAIEVEDSSDASREQRRWGSARLFFAMVAGLPVAALLLQIALPEDRPSDSETGHPIPRLLALAAWGLGGELPESLWPITDEEHELGVGHLPREVTVPMGTMLVAAWVWIAFSALAMFGRLVPSPRNRRAFLLIAPTILGMACYFAPEGAGTWPDPAYFWPEASRDSGIWTSDPPVLKSFGPVLVAALACALLLAFFTRRRSEPRTDCLSAGEGPLVRLAPK
jgi:hypothetical protein